MFKISSAFVPPHPLTKFLISFYSLCILLLINSHFSNIQIDCPACKVAKATSLGFVEFTNKAGPSSVFANYVCAACGVTSDVQLQMQ